MEQPEDGFPALLKPVGDTRLHFERLLPHLLQSRNPFCRLHVLWPRSEAVLIHQCLRGEMPGEQQCLVLPSEHPAVRHELQILGSSDTAQQILVIYTSVSTLK